MQQNPLFKDMKLFIAFIIELIDHIMSELELSGFMNKNVFNSIESLSFKS